jgi:Uma2 family endonuclease
MAREIREGLVHIRWTPEALDEMLLRGDLDAERHYEILNGELYEKMGHNRPHAFAVNALQIVFGRSDSPLFYAASQLPLRVGQDLLEPDLMVLQGTLLEHPDTPTPDEVLLVVEVSDSTYTSDFRLKLPIYASAQIPVYWILDVNHRRIQVLSRPVDGAYTEMDNFEDAAMLPPAFEGCPSVAVSDLFVPLP